MLAQAPVPASIAVTAFKAQCLSLLEDVARTGASTKRRAQRTLTRCLSLAAPSRFS